MPNVAQWVKITATIGFETIIKQKNIGGVIKKNWDDKPTKETEFLKYKDEQLKHGIWTSILWAA